MESSPHLLLLSICCKAFVVLIMQLPSQILPMFGGAVEGANHPPGLPGLDGKPRLHTSPSLTLEMHCFITAGMLGTVFSGD